MARPRTKGCVFQRSRGAGKGKGRFYWAKYTDEHGRPVRHVLTLPSGDKITHKDVAVTRLKEIEDRIQLKAVGLLNRNVESAGVPIAKVLAGCLDDLRRRKRTETTIEQVRCYAQWVIDAAGIVCLADLNRDRVNRALDLKEAEGVSAKTLNAYRGACYAVGSWAANPRRGNLLDRNLMDDVEVREGELAKERRALSVDEARRLLGVCGPRRAFYMVQLLTGYRVAEVGAIEWRHVQLEGDRPYVQLLLSDTKSGKRKRGRLTNLDQQIPLHPDLVSALDAIRPEFATSADPVFQTTPTLKSLKRDLDRAGIAFRDDLGRTVDRHSLRVTFETWLAVYGVSTTAQRVLMRHGARDVTTRHYLDPTLLNLWAEIDKLPSLGAVPEALQGTGTE